ncbi:bleomycin resistance protein [Sorangium sp. So ce233]|uniref:bleomycin resistance protein n=1 Tax=Sorangium sp. So ce233 TaxID=3133290 RepID=UPI003F5E51D1
MVQSLGARGLLERRAHEQRSATGHPIPRDETGMLMHSREWIAIPVLPCASIGETLSFWEALGFTVTYRQDSPYQYGVVERGGHELHFGRVKGVDPASSHSGCLIMVTDAQGTHREFSRSLRDLLGRAPTSGLPRISRFRPGQTRFTVTDPSGNSVIFIQLGEEDRNVYDRADDPALTPLQRAIARALRLRDFKEDDAAAARTLDAALTHIDGESGASVAEALRLRAELARAMNEPAREGACHARSDELGLSGEVAAVKGKREAQNGR